LQAIAVLGLLPHNIQDGIDEFGTLRVVTLGPVVSGAGLAKDEVIGAEYPAEGAGPDRIHCSRFEIHEDGTWNVPSATGLIIVDVDTLELEFGVTAVGSGLVDAVLAADDFPELGSDLVAALAALDVEDFSHFVCRESVGEGRGRFNYPLLPFIFSSSLLSCSFVDTISRTSLSLSLSLYTCGSYFSPFSLLFFDLLPLSIPIQPPHLNYFLPTNNFYLLIQILLRESNTAYLFPPIFFNLIVFK